MIFSDGAELIRTHQPDLIAYEEPYFPHVATQGAATWDAGRQASMVGADDPPADKPGNQVNIETLKQLQMVKGVITLLSALYSIPVEGYTSSHWRKAVVGYGRPPKGSGIDMKDAVRKHWRMLGYETRTNDESDALGILFCALHGPEAAARAQGDLLKMVHGKL